MPPLQRNGFEGYWGQISSTIDWCEENYVVTQYIAEFWNTVSNIVMIVPPLLAAIRAYRQQAEMRMVLCYLGLLAVGLGSWCFHMTLLYSMQLLDELPMIWGSIFLLYSILELEKPLHSKNRPLQLGLLAYCSIVTLVYLFIKIPIFFQISYALMVVTMVTSSIVLMLKYGSKLKLKLQVVAVGSYTLGFLLWLIDNNYCTSIRLFRRGTTPYIGSFTQLHAWWHILAGFGTYAGIVFGFHSRYTILKQQPQIKLFLRLWPYLELRKPFRSK